MSYVLSVAVLLMSIILYVEGLFLINALSFKELLQTEDYYSLSHQCRKQFGSEDIFKKFLGINSGFTHLLEDLPNLGGYEKCKANRSDEGKFCMIQIEDKALDMRLKIKGSSTYVTRFRNVAIASSVFGICVPKECNDGDVRSLIPFQQDYMILDVTCDDFKMTNVWISSAIKLLFVIWTIFVIMINVFPHVKRKPWMKSISIRNNLNILFSDNIGETQFPVIDAIRAVSCITVILGHVIEANMMFPSDNMLEIIKLSSSYNSWPILLTPLSVDQFLLIGGFLIGLKQKQFFQSLHKRVFRIILPMYPVTLIYHTILNDLGSGPYWLTTTKYVKNMCSNYWWSTYLLIHNYYNPDEMCAGHTWYLAMDFQLFLFSPFILYLLRSNFKLASILLFGFIVFIVTWTALKCYNEELAATPQRWTKEYFTTIYHPTHIRSPVWVIGLYIGFLFRINRVSKIGTSRSNIFWFLSIMIVTSISTVCALGSAYDEFLPFSALFTATHRILWSLVVLWLIFVCWNAQDSIIDKLLRWQVIKILSKLSYCMYLTHAPLQLIVNGNRKHAFHFNSETIFLDFLFQLGLTIAAALYWYIFIQAPIVHAFPILLKKKKNQ